MPFSPVLNLIRNVLFVIISIIVGVLIAITFANGTLPYIRVSIKAMLILASLMLAALVGTGILSYFMENPKIKSCLTGPGIPLLISSIGSIMVGLIALSLVLNYTLLSTQILIGFGGFFASLMVLSFIAFIICLILKTRPRPELG